MEALEKVFLGFLYIVHDSVSSPSVPKSGTVREKARCSGFCLGSSKSKYYQTEIFLYLNTLLNVKYL